MKNLAKWWPKLLVVMVVMLSLVVIPAIASASPSIGFAKVGTAIAELSTEQTHSPNYSAKFCVANGVADWAEVSIPVDIALKDIAELKFWEYIRSYTSNGYSVNVLLGVDCDSDGVFEADVPAWHQGATSHTLVVLGSDAFVEMDGISGNPTTGIWTETEALGVAQWWAPNTTGAGFCSYYGNFAGFLTFLDGVGNDCIIQNSNARVLCVKFLIGGSGSWMDETAYVDDITINGAVYDLTNQSTTFLVANIPAEEICVSVAPSSLDFGTMQRGDCKELLNVLTVTNCGDVPITVTATVSGSLYIDGNLDISHGAGWTEIPVWSTVIAVGANAKISLKLCIPLGFPAGTATGLVSFIAQAQ